MSAALELDWKGATVSITTRLGWHSQQPLRPRAGGWRYDHADRAHYGAGAVVTRSHTGRWEVYDYREIAAPLPVPWRDFPTPEEAKAAWDAHAQGLNTPRQPLPSTKETSQ